MPELKAKYLFLLFLLIFILLFSIISPHLSVSEVQGKYITPESSRNENVLKHSDSPIQSCDYSNLPFPKDPTVTINTLKALFRKYPNNHVIDVVSYKTGIGVLQGRSLKNDFSQSAMKPPFYKGTVYFPDPTETLLLNDAVNTHQFLTLQKAISASDFRQDIVFSGKYYLLFPLGYAIENLSTQLANQVVPQLLDAGLIPKRSDLLVATSKGLDREIVSDMLELAEFPVDIGWDYQGRSQSLLLSAITSGNYDLALFWLEHNSPVAPDSFFANGLDLLVLRNDLFSEQHFYSLTKLLLNKGYSPLLPKSLEWFKQNLPTSILDTYSQQLSQVARFRLNESQQKEVKTLSEQILILVLGESYAKTMMEKDALVKYSTARPFCLYKAVGHLVNKLLLATTANSPDRVVIKNDSLDRKKHKTNSNAMRFNELQEQYSDNSEIEAVLGAGRTLESKGLVESFREKLIADKGAKIRNQLNVNSDEWKPEPDDEIRARIIERAMAGEWNSVFELVQQLSSSAIAKQQLLLELLLGYEGPWFRIEMLLEQGVALPEHAILNLIVRDNIDYLIKLMPFGLNLASSQYPEDIVIIAAVRYKARHILSFLINKGFNVNSERFGYDPLDYALKDMNFQRDKGIFVQLLIEGGAIIYTSHKEWVANKFDSDFEAYAWLVATYPALAL